MYGFKKGAGKAERKSFANGGAVDDGASPHAASRGSGMVRGPGTGTSDDVKDAVPPGTYIMPADSTQEIGPEALGAAGFRPGSKPKAPNIPGMGFGASAQVPVNLSNGEFRLSPEQVHAIGVQVLEGMKAATHTPAGEQGGSDGDDASTRELFFVDGGLVENPNKRGPFDYQAPGSTPPRPGPAPIPGAERNDLPVRDSARASYGQIGAPAATKPAAPLESPVKGPLDSLGTAYGATANKLSFGAFDSRGDEIRQQNRAGLIAQPDQPAAASPSPQAQSLTTNPGLAPAPAASATPPNSGPVPYTVTPVENTNGVQRINQPGKSPLFTNIDPGQAVAEMKGNPVGGFRPGAARGDAAGAAGAGQGMGFGPGSAASNPDVLGILQRESDIRAGMGAIQDRINFNGGNGVGFRQTEQGERSFTTIRDGAQAERDRAAVMDAALKPLAGARNGQLTANQLRTAQGMVSNEYQTDANAATQLETTGMREAGANNRANASNQIQQGELGLRKEAQGFQSRAAQHQEDLQAKYEAAKTPEERSAIAQQIRDLSGKQEPQNRFTVVPGGQEWDANAGAMRNVPGRVINNQTGLDVQRPTQGAGQQPQAMPAEKSKLSAGVIYQTARGPAKWDGNQFVGV